jgi:uncharacterized membrane protein
MDFKVFYISTIEASIFIFLIFNIKLLYHKYILKDKEDDIDSNNSIIQRTDNLNPWSMRHEVSYKFSLDFRTFQGKLIMFIGCFIPVINLIFSLVEICIIFSSEDINFNL